MKLNTAVNRYIFKELIPPYTMNLLFFIFVFLMHQILEITNVIVNYQVGLISVILMIAYSMPFFSCLHYPHVGDDECAVNFSASFQ